MYVSLSLSQYSYCSRLYSQHSRSLKYAGAFRTRTGRCAAGAGLVTLSAGVAATGPGVAVAVDLLDFGVDEAWGLDEGCTWDLGE